MSAPDLRNNLPKLLEKRVEEARADRRGLEVALQEVQRREETWKRLLEAHKEGRSEEVISILRNWEDEVDPGLEAWFEELCRELREEAKCAARRFDTLAREIRGLCAAAGPRGEQVISDDSSLELGAPDLQEESSERRPVVPNPAEQPDTATSLKTATPGRDQEVQGTSPQAPVAEESRRGLECRSSSYRADPCDGLDPSSGTIYRTDVSSDASLGSVPTALERLASSEDADARLAAAQDVRTPRQRLLDLQNDPQESVCREAALTCNYMDASTSERLAASLAASFMTEQGQDLFALLEETESAADSNKPESFGVWDRAQRVASEIMDRAGWTYGWEVLVEVLNRPNWGALRVTIEREILRGMTPEELELAVDLRLHWSEWYEGQCWYRLSWANTLAFIRAFDSYPDPLELRVMMAWLYEQYQSERGSCRFKDYWYRDRWHRLNSFYCYLGNLLRDMEYRGSSWELEIRSRGGC